MEENELKLILQEGESYRIEFKEEKTPQKTVSQLEQEILSIINNDIKVTRNETAKKLNIGSETVKEYLAKLKEKRLLKRIGPDKGGYWEVIERE